MSSRSRATLVYVVLALGMHWLALSGFIIARKSDEQGWIERQEQAWREDRGTWSSADPLTHWAERPLYNWSEWHGGERAWVKALVGANLFPFYATLLIDWELSTHHDHEAAEPPFRDHSWRMASIFAALSSFQWIVLGWVFGRCRIASASNSTLQPTPTRAT